MGLGVMALAATVLGCRRHDIAEGTVQGTVEREERILSFEVSGRLAEVLVKRGDRLSAGGKVALLDDSLARLGADRRAEESKAAHAAEQLLRAGPRPEDLRAMQAEVEAARENEAIIEKSLRRTQRLVEEGAQPAALLDDLNAQLARAHGTRLSSEQRLTAMRRGARSEELAGSRARAEAASAAADAERQRLARFELVSHFPGAVIDVHVHADEVVAPGTPVVTVAVDGDPYADVFVPVAQIAYVKVGDGVTVRVDGVEHSFSAQVEHIYSHAEFTPRYLFSPRERATLVIRVRLRIADPERQLHAGMPAFARLSAHAQEGPR